MLYRNKEKFYTKARENMVLNQIIPHGVVDELIIKAFTKTKRHEFVNSRYRDLAYVDAILPTRDMDLFSKEENRYMIQADVLARILQESKISKDSTVIDINCGTGYSTVILAQLAKMIYATDKEDWFLKFASEKLADLNLIDNVIFKRFINFKTFSCSVDIIFIGGIVNNLPNYITSKLNVSGEIFTFEKSEFGYSCVKYKKFDGDLAREELFNVALDKYFKQFTLCDS